LTKEYGWCIMVNDFMMAYGVCARLTQHIVVF